LANGPEKNAEETKQWQFNEEMLLAFLMLFLKDIWGQ